MEASTRLNPAESNRKVHAPCCSAQVKVCVFALAIIGGVGGLVVGGVGLLAIFRVGALSNLSQVSAIIMMTVGGGGGAVLLLGAVVGSVQSCRASRSESHSAVIETDDMQEIDDVEKTPIELPKDFKAYGKTVWDERLGKVDAEPPLPPNIIEILERKCPFSNNENVKIKDSHILFLVPKTVRDTPFTLNRLQELVEDPLRGPHASFGIYTARYYSCAEKQVEKSYWILMTRNAIHESSGLTHKEQQEVLKKYKNLGYTLPTALEAATCILLEHVTRYEKIFSKTHLIPYTYCSDFSDVVNGYPVLVGGFADDRLDIGALSLRDEDCGSAAVIRFDQPL